MASQVEDFDVAVVGAGPSGLLTAGELALAGVRTVVLERRGAPALPRAGTLAPRVLEIFDSRGLADSVLERAFEMHTEPRAYDGIWAGFPGVDYQQLDSPFPFVLVFAQVETEKILAAHATSLGAELRRDHEVIALDESPESVILVARQSDGTTKAVRAKYVVGADGARSAVRRLAGIPFDGHAATRTAVNVDAVLDYPWPKPIMVTNNLNGWALSYPLRHGLTRFGLIDTIESYKPQSQPMTIEDARGVLTRILGTDFGIREATISRFHDEMRLAGQMHKGRVVLVGESVRVHYPASGVGMNFCLQDAFNLGWKLAATVQDRAPSGLLGSYEAERRPEVQRLLDDVRRQCAVQFTFTEEMLAMKAMIERELIPIPEVNKMLAMNLSGLSARYLPKASDASPLVGRRLRDVTVIDFRGARARVYELLRQQQFLLLRRGDSPNHSREARTDVVHANFASDVSGELAGLDSVLVRPDGHVAEASAGMLDEDAVTQWVSPR